MEDKILLVIQFAVELILMWVGMTAVFGGTVKRIWLGVITYALFVGWVFWGADSISDSFLWMWGLLVVLYFITVKAPLLQDWKWKVRYGFLLFYIEELVYMIVNDVVHYHWKLLTEYEIELLSSVMILIVIGATAIVRQIHKRRFRNFDIYRYVQKGIIPMVVFVVLEMLFHIEGFNYIAQDIGNERQHMIARILSLLSMIGIGLLVVMVFYIKDMNEKMEHMLLMEKQMQQIQVQYYEALLRKEEETRRYRHDMDDHLLCLQNLANEGENVQMKEYISNMREHAEGIYNETFDTGIRMLDAVLNHYAGQLESEIAMQVEGMCEGTVAVSNMDLCTIFSNLIRNAVEAVKVSGQSERILAVSIETGRTFVRVEIKNSMNMTNLVVDEDGNFQTTKGDKRNHGLGMLNVKECIRKNRGMFLMYKEEQQFCCQVTLPLR